MNVCWLGNALFLTEKIYVMVSFKEVRRFFIYSNSKITLLLPVMFAGIQCSFLTENYALQTASLFKVAKGCFLVTKIFKVFSERIDGDLPVVDTVTLKKNSCNLQKMRLMEKPH